MKYIGQVLVMFGVAVLSAYAASPVPYSGKIDIRGVNYFGEAQFAFSLHDGNGTTHWRNGNQPKETIKVTIRNGRYNVLLGGQGMNSLPPELFLKHDKLYLKVEFDNGDGEGLRHLALDQLITATPRALVAEVAKVAQVAEKVGNGVITRDMLNQEVLSQLDANATSSPSTPITITRDMLPASVLNDLNKTVSITRDMLPQDVRDDLNKSVTVTRNMLPTDVLSDLNATIGMNRLSAEVTGKLERNATLADGSITGNKLANKTITTAQLSEQILKYLKPEITTPPQAQTVYADTNASFSVTAEGKFLTYQWAKDGSNIGGETNATLNITDANANQHDGNYSVVVSNDFGSVSINNFEILVSEWIPSIKADLLLWLDASDISTISESSYLVSQWRDKSGNNNHALQNNSTYMPQAGFADKMLKFDGQDGLFISNESSFDLIQFSIFAVIKGGGTIFAKNTTSTSTSSQARRKLTLKHSLFSSGGDSNNVLSFENTATSVKKIIGFVSSNLSSHLYSINGDLRSSSVTLSTNVFNDALPSVGAAFSQVAEGLNGSIGEIIIFSSTSTELEIEKIEGYLAHKWGLTNNLPTDHPYKNNAP
jgi:hypothetical protein